MANTANTWADSRSARIEALFDAALQLPRQERAGFLEGACDDPEIRAETLALLEHHAAAASDFLARPAAEAFPALASDAGLQVAEFRIQRELGRGAMGAVYLADDTVLHRPVALKVLMPSLVCSPDAVQRFQQEARAAARLDHPGIVRIFRYGEDRGTYFIAMQFVEGATLEHKLDELREGRPELGGQVSRGRPTRTATGKYLLNVARMTCTVARALDSAHTAGVLHRDVKPSNILIDAEGEPRVADFGIAKLDAADLLTQPGDSAGTPSYMSPEQANAAPLDRRSDVFSLGVVLYEMLTLEHPFAGKCLAEILDAIRAREPRPIRSLNPWVQKDLEIICMKAIEKDCLHRYPTAAHLAADLDCFIRGEPILARPPALRRRASRWFKQRRFAVAVTLCAALATSLVAAGQRQREQHLASMTQVNIRVEGTSPAAVFALPWNPELRTYGPAENLGPAPLLQKYFSPGPYRFHAVATDGAFMESDEILTAGGTVTRTLRAPQIDSQEMVHYPAGTYIVTGPDPADPGKWTDLTAYLPGFFLDASEVSNSDYLEFVQATEHPMPEQWRTFGFDERLAERPVVNISHEDAQAYAIWRGKRLPTAIEWEAAARYPDGRKHPRGALESVPAAMRPSYDALVSSQAIELAVLYEEYSLHTVNVNDDIAPHSASGIRHLNGNVSELTGTAPINNLTIAVVKGGSWSDHPKYSDFTTSWSRLRTEGSFRVGFRCARSVNPEAP